MEKNKRLARYGVVMYKKQQAQNAAWRKAHPKVVAAAHAERDQKGGKHYDKKLLDQRTGLPGDKNMIRKKHAYKHRPYKNIIAPGSQIHHEWIPGTADYRGVALVEKDRHMYGTVDVIEILKGKITLLREEEIRNRGTE